MIAVTFEVMPEPGEEASYLSEAASLRAELEAIDGFLSVERFQSLSEPGKVLSLSFFRDEAAVSAWRRSSAHRAAQDKGRTGLFRHYRLRVAWVMRDYGLHDRAAVPEDSKTRDREKGLCPSSPTASSPHPGILLPR